ncbi:hypothetical protein PAMP_002962 [Pampus punctatissimus]
MHSLCYIALLFLCSFSALPSVLSIQCNKTQYAWPISTPNLCCGKCTPGEYMVRRPENSCGTVCQPCPDDRYTDTYNVMMSCNFCKECKESNMEYGSVCNTTHDAVCKCIAGFRCADQPCTECVPIPTTTTPTLPPPTTAFTDTMWYLVTITALLCVGITLIVTTKLKSLLHWMRSKHGYILAKKATPLPQSTTEDEGVSKPVQEMCGKCEQLIV